MDRIVDQVVKIRVFYHLLRSSIFHYSVCKDPLPVPILIQIDPDLGRK
jgi:hypothetical protein